MFAMKITIKIPCESINFPRCFHAHALEDGFLTELQMVHGTAPQLRQLSLRHGKGKKRGRMYVRSIYLIIFIY